MHTNRRLFIKQLGFGAAGLTLISIIPSSGGIVRNNKHSLPRSLPEQQGVSSAGILEFLNDVEKNKIGFHSIMIICHGHVIAEGWWSPYAPQFKHTLYSLSKSFTSTAVGFAVAEGHLTVNDPVTSFFPDDVPDPISDNLAAMKVKDLLTMSTGQAKEPARDSKDVSWVKTFLAAPVEYTPGSRFHYNSMATYMCSAIVQKLTGQPIIEYLKPRLFDPLGIEGMDWESSPQGINVGGWGLRVKTEDIAKFGLLYLQKGMWQGKQILPAAWVEEATSKQVESNPSSAEYTADNDWAQGYGYQFWRCSPGGYRGDGAFGQFCIVNPDLDMVIAATSESFNMGASMKSMWNYLLPAVKSTTIASSNAEQKQVAERLKNLTLGFPQANSTSPLVQKITGKKFAIDANELKVKSISFSFAKDSCTLNVSADSGEHRIVCGINKWKKNEKASAVFQLPARVYVSTSETAGVAWTDDNTLVVTERFTETAHGDQLTCTFEDDSVSIKFLNSVAQGNPNNPDKRPELKGKLIT